MSARLEQFLARIYVDEEAREAFLADPEGETARSAADLDAADRAALCRVDPVALRLAARSFASKRAHAPRRSARSRLRECLRRALAGRRLF